jgi:hypothetical protein
MQNSVRARCGRRSILVIAVVVAFWVLSAPTAAASPQCTRFAAPDGSDQNDGGASTPFQTAQRLVDALSPGETGCLRAGSYGDALTGDVFDDYVLRFPRAGTATEPIRIRSYPGERATLKGIVLVPPGANWVALSDVDVEGTAVQNTVKVYAADVVIERNDITNWLRGRSCMLLGSNSGSPAVRTVVRANRFHDCGSPLNGNKDHGIYVAGAVDGRIEDNVFVNSTGRSIQLFPNARGTRVAHNVIDGGPDTIRGGIVIGGNETHVSDGNIVERNVIAHTADSGVYANWGSVVGSDNVVRDNCLHAVGTAETVMGDGINPSGNLFADPLFADRSARDHRLAHDSPCLPLVGHDTAATVAGSAPIVSLTSPLEGSTFGRWTLLAADATSGAGIAKVEYLLDGTPVATEYGAPYRVYVQVPPDLTYGMHRVAAKAYDWTGATTSSAPVAVGHVP